VAAFFPLRAALLAGNTLAAGGYFNPRGALHSDGSFTTGGCFDLFLLFPADLLRPDPLSSLPPQLLDPSLVQQLVRRLLLRVCLPNTLFAGAL
jgi:hypothetical protein